MKQLAKVILDAQRIREESYDHKAAAGNTEKKFVDYNQFYSKSIYDATCKAAENAGFDSCRTQLIYLLLASCRGDDVQIWAEDAIKD